MCNKGMIYDQKTGGQRGDWSGDLEYKGELKRKT